MIKLVTDERLLKKYPGGDLYYVKIMSLAVVYGFGYDFLRFYVQLSGAKVTAALCVLDSDITVSFGSAADTGEIAYFLSMTGYNSILCPGALPLGADFETGAVMKNSAAASVACKKIAVTESVPLKPLYDFLETGADFDFWYADISHRIRHGGARAYAAVQGGELVSAAVLSAIYGNMAVLSAVKTGEGHRGRGYSSAVVRHIVARFGGKIYLMRQNGENESFYQKLGFENTGIWRIYR